jgi:hypothetical protein
MSLFASAPIQQARWAACNKCPNKADLGFLICRACSCILASKISIEAAQCPLGKWPTPQKAELSQN